VNATGEGLRLTRRGLATVVATLALPGLAQAGRGSRVELLVPGSPGSPTSRWARGVAPFLERCWPRQSVTLRAVSGRGGLQAVTELAASGTRRVIGVLTTPSLLSRAIEVNAPSPLSRIDPLAALVEELVLLVTAPGAAGDLDALRAAAPGAPIGSPPAGTGPHLTAMRLAERLDRPVLVFPSAAAARQAAMAGHVAAATLTLPDAVQFLREERLTAIGVASSRRSPLLPELATLREAGLELLGATRRGFALSPEADPAWRAQLVEGLQALATDADLIAHCAENGQVPRFLGPAAWGGLLARQEEELRRRWQDDPWVPRRAGPG